MAEFFKKFFSKIAAGLKLFVFGEDENKVREQIKGRLSLVTPKNRVRFESELKVEEDFDRAISLLTKEKDILFHKEY